MTTNTPTQGPAFTDLLREVVEKPGVLSSAYSMFHNYSFGNMMAAVWQLADRNQPLGPIASFNRWKELGRHVKKGAKALVLCMPVTARGIKTNEDGTQEEYSFNRFIWKKNWFVLQDTEGADFVNEVVTPKWDAALALETLGVTTEQFSYIDGNCQGYAQAKTIAINPVAQYPHKTRFHELAHIVLGHTSEGEKMVDNDFTPRDVREVEDESTAYILLNLLDLPGKEESRGYVQHWLGDADISEKSAQRIYSAADKIFKAGQVKKGTEE